MEWQTYSTMGEKGVKIGIALYDGDDTKVELECSTVYSPDAITTMNSALEDLQQVCVIFNCREVQP